MTDDLSTLRDALASARRLQRIYPEHLRKQALAVARSLGASFRSCSLVAKQLGLPPATLRSWFKTAAPASPSFLPVIVRPTTATTSHTLVLPGGARVEGLSLDDLASLCRRVAS